MAELSAWTQQSTPANSAAQSSSSAHFVPPTITSAPSTSQGNGSYSLLRHFLTKPPQQILPIPTVASSSSPQPLRPQPTYGAAPILPIIPAEQIPGYLPLQNPYTQAPPSVEYTQQQQKQNAVFMQHLWLAYQREKMKNQYMEAQIQQRLPGPPNNLLPPNPELAPQSHPFYTQIPTQPGLKLPTVPSESRRNSTEEEEATTYTDLSIAR